MIVSAHQPHYMPWIGYINKIFLSDIFVLVDNVQFVKKYVAENKIVTKNGELQLSVPVFCHKGNKNVFIRDAKISYEKQGRWISKHLKSIELNYYKSVSFKILFPEIEKILNSKPETIFQLDFQLLNLFLNYLNIGTKVIVASEMEISGKKNDDLMLSILSKTGSNELLLGIGASTLYVNRQLIIDKGFKLLFLKFEHPVYKQKSKNFVKGISSLDLLMNCSQKEASDIVRNSGNIKT